MSTVTPVAEKDTTLQAAPKTESTKEKPRITKASRNQEKTQSAAPAKSKQSSQRKTASKQKTKPKASAVQPETPVEGKNQKLGRLGEDMACYYLSDKSITLLERNWKCSYGEADIIAEEDGTLVFIEVKTRSEDYPGLPEYAVTKQKRARYENIAMSYLSKNERPSGRVRFDVIAIRMTGENQCMLRHHRDAFASGE